MMFLMEVEVALSVFLFYILSDSEDVWSCRPVHVLPLSATLVDCLPMSVTVL